MNAKEWTLPYGIDERTGTELKGHTVRWFVDQRNDASAILYLGKCLSNERRSTKPDKNAMAAFEDGIEYARGKFSSIDQKQSVDELFVASQETYAGRVGSKKIQMLEERVKQTIKMLLEEQEHDVIKIIHVLCGRAE